MGFLQRVSTVARPPMRAIGQNWDDFDDRWYIPDMWSGSLSAAGVAVTPDLAMTLSAMYCGVTTIAYDLATLPCHVFKYRDDGGKDRVKGGSFQVGTGGIGHLVYMLRWAPNNYQTAADFMLGCVAQFLLRGRCFVELTTGGPDGFLDQMLPRHPDRVFTERLPTGRLRYRLTETDGSYRYLTQDEMLVVRDMTMDGLNGWSRIQYGSQALGVALAAERAAGKFFKSGMTSSVVATYKGEMDDEAEAALHKSISRYAAGVENSFGLMLIPDDVTVTNLGVEPDKAQMMLAREWGVAEVARQLRMPGYKLGIKSATSYNSQVQAATDYVISTLRPVAVIFEQAYQRDLIIAKDTYFTEINLEGLLRGDPLARADLYAKGIQHRWMRPSEVRLLENMNPDPALDQLSELDFRPGAPRQGPDTQQTDPAAVPGKNQDGNPPNNAWNSRATLKATLVAHDNAIRCLRRERAAVEKLAKKHANDPAGWQAALRTFFSDQAGFLSQVMRLHPAVARGVAAQHGSELEIKGIGIYDDDSWERFEAEELLALALSEGNTIDAWFDRRLTDVRPPAPVHVHAPVTIDRGAVQVDARTTIAAAEHHTHIDKGAIAIDVDVAAPPPARIELHAGDVHIEPGAVAVTLPPPVAVERVTEVDRDENRLIVQTRTRDVPIPKE